MAEIEKVIPIQKARPIVKNPPTNPEELRDFFNERGIYELARPMEWLLEQAGQPIEDSKVILTEDDDTGREFRAYWHHSVEQNHRLLVIQSNLGSLSGLFLTVPTELDDYRASRMGSICASYVPKIIKGRSKVGHYLKQGAGLEIGKPAVAARVQRIAARQLLKACGVTKVAELETTSAFELSAV